MGDERSRNWASYYQGAYGPTILIAVHDQATARLVQSAFLKLAEDGGECEIDLLNYAGISSDDINIIATSTVASIFPAKNRLYISPGTSVAKFHWTLTQDEWMTAAMLIDHDVSTGTGWHQYVSDPGADGVLVIFSFREHHCMPK